MRVCLMGRVSGRKQKQADTIATQQYHLHAWAEAGGHEVVGEYWDENVSSSVPLADRKEGGRMLRELADLKPDAVVVYKSGRFSRVPEIYHQGRALLIKAGVDLVSLRDDLRWKRASDKLASGVQLLVNEWDRNNLIENLQDGAHAAAEAGFYVGGVVAMGYRVIDLPVPGKRSRRGLAIDDQEAAVVRLVYRLLAEDGLSPVQVAAYLNERRIPTATANTQNGHRLHHNGRAATTGLWTAQHVCSLVRNPIFKGTRTWGNREVSCPAIVSPEVWAAANATLVRNRRTAIRNSRRTYLLTGLVRCRHCVRTYTGLARAFNTDRERRWYRCSGAWEAGQGWRPASCLCPVPMVPAEAREAEVWRLVVQHVSHYEETLERLAQTQADSALEEVAATKRRDALARERAKLCARRDAALLGHTPEGAPLSAPEQRALLDLVANRLAAIDEELDCLDDLAKAQAKRESRLSHAEAHLRSWSDRVAGVTDDRIKRHITHLFVDRIDVVAVDDEVFYDVHLIFGDEVHSIDSAKACPGASWCPSPSFPASGRPDPSAR